MSDDLKIRITELFREKLKADKRMFYIRDITKWLPNEDRHAIQNAVKKLLDEGVLVYWSSGSTTYIMLAECFPKEDGTCSQ